MTQFCKEKKYKGKKNISFFVFEIGKAQPGLLV